jgi:hypothetical protein
MVFYTTSKMLTSFTVCFPVSMLKCTLIGHVGFQPLTTDSRSNPTPEGFEPLTKSSRSNSPTNCTLWHPTHTSVISSTPRANNYPTQFIFKTKCITNPSITHTDKVMHALADYDKAIQGMTGIVRTSQATQDLQHIVAVKQAHLQASPYKFEETTTPEDTHNTQQVPRV